MLTLAFTLALAGCGNARVRPFTYQDNKEMTGKPGLFTGPSSEVAIIRQ